MNKLVAILLIISLTIPSLALSEDGVQEFTYGNGVNFGITIDDVKAIYGKPSLTYDSKLSYIRGVSFAGLTATIDFSFNDKLLNQVILFFNLLPSDETDYVSDFNTIDAALLSQYPDEAYTGMPAWLDENYTNKENQNLAIKDGALILMSDFKQDGLEVQHIIQFFGTTPVHTVTYLPTN